MERSTTRAVTAQARQPETDVSAAAFGALLDGYRERLAGLADRRRAVALQDLAQREAELGRARALVGTANDLTGKPHSWTSAREAADADAATMADRRALVSERHALELAEGEAGVARFELLWCLADRRRSIAAEAG